MLSVYLLGDNIGDGSGGGGGGMGGHAYFWAAAAYDMRALTRPRGANYDEPENAWHLATCSQEKEDGKWQEIKS